LWPGGDAVHAPTPFAPPAPKRGRGLVVTVHDTVPWTHPDTLTPRGVAWHRRVIDRALNTASAIVVPTAAVAAELTQHTLGNTRVHVIGHGVSDAVVRPSPDDEAAQRIRERLGLPREYVLAIGTMEPRKGLDVLVDAMSRPGAPHLPLVIVGSRGWGDVDPHALAAHRGLDPARLLVLGGITDAELSVVLHGASVFAAPSLAEGFGLPLLEAMAAGVPVVHSDAPALVEVAAGTGVMVRRQDPIALANALRKVLADPERTQSLVAAAKQRAGHFTWDRCAHAVWQLHVELYQSRLAGLI
jgi:glycosyltransferase involved in cell wall biosynthesis